MAITEMFDFYDVGRNQIIGDTMLFVVISFILANYFCLKSKVPKEVTVVINILLSGLLFEKTRIALMWGVTLLFVGFIGYNAINKALTR
jgi:hypothetical protein